MSTFVNKLNYHQVQVGDKYSFSHTFSPEDLDLFSRISGDFNPLHNDFRFAKERGFKDRVVHGVLLTSLYSQLCGCHVPGEDSLIHQIEVSFIKPTFPNQILNLDAEIVSKSDAFKLLDIKASIKNNDLETVSKAKIRVSFHENKSK